MKIIDVSLTLFTWDDIPATSYGAHRGKFSGSSQLGLLALRTDEGLTGHSFLGAASNGADIDGLGLIRYLKPIVMGQDPLDRERLNESMWRRGRPTTTRAIGAMDIALWDIAGQAAGMPLHRLMGSYRDRIGAYASSQVLPDAGSYVDDALQFKAAGIPPKLGEKTLVFVKQFAMLWGLTTNSCLIPPGRTNTKQHYVLGLRFKTWTITGLKIR